MSYRKYENLDNQSSSSSFSSSYSTASYSSAYNNTLPLNNTNDIMSIQNSQHKHKIISDNVITCNYVWGTFCKSCINATTGYSEFSKKYNTNTKSVMFVKEDVNLGLSDCKAVPIFQIFIKGNPKYVAQVLGPNFDELKQVLDKIKESLKLT
jgi:hypothetical protein